MKAPVAPTLTKLLRLMPSQYRRCAVAFESMWSMPETFESFGGGEAGGTRGVFEDNRQQPEMSNFSGWKWGQDRETGECRN